MPNLNSRQFGSGLDAKAVTPSDAIDLPNGMCRAVYIGGSGTLRITTGGNTVVNFVGLSAGQTLPVTAKRIWSTGTTATNIVAVY